MLDSVISFIQSGDVLSFFIKAFAVVMLSLYFFYALIFIRQIQVMKKILTLRDGGLLLLLAYFQIIAVIALLVYAVLIL